MTGVRALAPLLVLAMGLTGCHREAPVAPAETEVAPVAAVLAASVCEQLDGRLFTFASETAGPIDTYVLPKRCSAASQRDELHVVADAFVWLAVDREIGAVRVREFVHTTVHVDGRVRTHARWADDHLELELSPQPGLVVRVEPVGVLQLHALNWASLLALELAPSVGASPSALAKSKLREEAEEILRSKLGGVLVVSYDAATGATWFDRKRPTLEGEAASSQSARKVRLVPHGTAFLGPFPPSEMPSSARVAVSDGHRAMMRAVCIGHAARLLDADRRGDAVSIGDWIEVAGDASSPLPSMRCRWMLALRGAPDETSTLAIDLRPGSVAALSAPERDRWVSIDVVELRDSAVEVDSVTIGTDVWRRVIRPRGGASNGAHLPGIIELSADQALAVQALGVDGAVLAEARVPLERFPAVVALTARDGHPMGVLHIEARVKEAPPGGELRH
ncbi:MAG: hypothetical protein K0S65_4048 [Labilithrix sp.]|nr:hypothetical protein [Labilithrix sp.]